uniref:Uncharacterized protein n=1 Tax=Avena sativa TaxID=4498 RepID=A0ACD5ZGH3_AVESA
MAATTCAYGYGSSSCPPSAPAPAIMVGSPTAARSLQAMDPFGHQTYGHFGPIVHGVVMPPPPAPPPPPLPPPPLDLHSRARSGHPGSNNKATSRDPGLCTEGLGSESSESSGDVDLGDAIEDKEAEQYKGLQHFDDHEETTTVPARASGGGRVFPPPISVIGAAGKPWQYLRAHRGDGRLVLREVRIPSRELLQACREDGRLKLHFARQDQLADDDHCHGRLELAAD